MSATETVCAVVVTYNRKDLLIECLDAILKQTRPVQSIYIIDNHSTDGTPQLLLEKGYINELPPDKLTEPWETESHIQNLTDREYIKIHYVRMHENTGSSGGYHEGVKRGYKRGYDWLWLMDDDVEPLPDALESQLRYKHISLCIHPSKQYKDGELFNWEGFIDEASGYAFQPLSEEFRKEKEWTCVNFGCFEGMLVNRSVIKKIGYPYKNFFAFYGDDTYYGYLASKITNNIYIRKVCFIKKLRPINRKYNPLHIYLRARNIYGFLSRKISKNKKVYILYTSALLIYMSLKYCLRLKPHLVFWLCSGFIDGLREIWGKERRFFNKK